MDKSKDFFEICCDNTITQIDNSYYCNLCKTTFSEQLAAFLHINERNHQSKKTKVFPNKQLNLHLPPEFFETCFCNSIVVLPSYYKCVRCNCNIYSEVDLLGHISGRRHQAKGDPQLPGNATTEANKNQGQATHNPVKKRSLNSITKQSAHDPVVKKSFNNPVGKQSSNNLAERQSVNNPDKKPVRTMPSTDSSVNYFKNAVTIYKGLYYCHLCKETFNNYQSADLHIENPTHRQLRSNNQYLNDEFDLRQDYYVEFVTQSIVMTSIKKIKCLTCSISISSLKCVNEHILGRSHKKLMNNSALETEKLNGKKQTLNNNSLIRSLTCFKNSIVFHDNFSYCHLCDKIFKESITAHVQDKNHQSFRRSSPVVYYQDSWIGDLMPDYCEQWCTETLVVIQRDILCCLACQEKIDTIESMEKHIIMKKHKQNIRNFLKIDKVDEVNGSKGKRRMKGGEKKLKEECSNKIETHIDQIENKVDEIQSMKQQFTILFENSFTFHVGFYVCYLCKTNFVDVNSALEHTKDPNHRVLNNKKDKITSGNISKAYKNFVLNSIVHISGEKFKCMVCSCYLSKSVRIRQHIRGTKHTTLLKDSMPIRDSRKKIIICFDNFVTIKENIFYCNMCEKGFGNYENLVDHTREYIHQSLKKIFECAEHKEIFPESLYKVSVHQGIFPIMTERNMKYKCYTCETIIDKHEDIEPHSLGKRHTDNFIAKKYPLEILTNMTDDCVENLSTNTDDSESSSSNFTNDVSTEVSESDVAYEIVESFNSRHQETINPLAHATIEIGDTSSDTSSLNSAESEVEQSELKENTPIGESKSDSNICFNNYITFRDNFYFCNLCKKGFDNYQNLVDHTEESEHYSLKNPFECENLKEIFPERSYGVSVTQGIFPIMERENVKWKCFTCEIIMDNHKNIEEHSLGKRHKNNFSVKRILSVDSIDNISKQVENLSINTVDSSPSSSNLTDNVSTKVSRSDVADKREGSLNFEHQETIDSLAHVTIKIGDTSSSTSSLNSAESKVKKSGLKENTTIKESKSDLNICFNNYITFRDDFYFCNLCRKGLDNFQNVIDHTQESEHCAIKMQFNDQDLEVILPHDFYEVCVFHCVFPIIRSNITKYRCFTCKNGSMIDKDIKPHILGNPHHKKFSTKKYPEEYPIIFENSRSIQCFITCFENSVVIHNNLYHCHLCNKIIEDSVTAHIKNIEHQSLKRSSAAKLNRNSWIYEWVPYHCEQWCAETVVMISQDTLCCLACNEHYTTAKSIHKHITNQEHKSRIGTFSTIDEPVKSKECKIKRRAKKLDKITLDAFLENISSATMILLEKTQSDLNLCFNNYIMFGDNFYLCLLCNKKLDNFGNLIGHTQAIKHCRLKKEYNFHDRNVVAPHVYETYIFHGIFPKFENEENEYKCFICNSNMNSKNVASHILEKQHRRDLRAYKDRTGNAKKGKHNSEVSESNLSAHQENLFNSAYRERFEALTLAAVSNEDTSSGTFISSKTELKLIKSNSEKSGKKSHEDTEKKQTENEKRRKTVQGMFVFCNICDEKFMSFSKLHEHASIHFGQFFGPKNPADEQINDNVSTRDWFKNDSDEESTDVVVTGYFNKPGEHVPEIVPIRKCARGTVPLEKSEKFRSPKDRSRDLDVETDKPKINFDIYKIDEEQLKMIKFSINRCIKVDENKVYCLVCRESIENVPIKMLEHFRDIDHNKYLWQMIVDDFGFQSFPKVLQLSDLQLARESMQEISDETVHCYACNTDVKNVISSLKRHLTIQQHHVKREQKALNDEEILGKLERNWYNAQGYWCMFCNIRFSRETRFVAHLMKKKHKKVCKKFSEHKDLIFDYCPTCITLIYGTRETFAYHMQSKHHKYYRDKPFFLVSNLSATGEQMLNDPDSIAEKIVESVDTNAKQRQKDTEMIIEDLETIISQFIEAKAWPFGSRISGLGSDVSDLDIFLDCNNRYYRGHMSDNVLEELKQVENALKLCSSIWTIHRTITNCRVPIIKLSHITTGIECDISFTNGLTYENTQLLKTILQKLPLSRKLILFIKQWIQNESLSGTEGISSYAIAWMVIYYLQTKFILPTIITLIEQCGESKIIGDWEVGVNLDFDIPTIDYNFKMILKGFFKMYGEFDYRNNIICPLLGEPIKKKQFVDPINCLPVEMDTYKCYIGHPDHKPLAFDSTMVVQDPLDLSNNITKAVDKVTVSKLRKLCLLSSKKFDNYYKLYL